MSVPSGGSCLTSSEQRNAGILQRAVQQSDCGNHLKSHVPSAAAQHPSRRQALDGDGLHVDVIQPLDTPVGIVDGYRLQEVTAADIAGDTLLRCAWKGQTGRE